MPERNSLIIKKVEKCYSVEYEIPSPVSSIPERGFLTNDESGGEAYVSFFDAISAVTTLRQDFYSRGVDIRISMENALVEPEEAKAFYAIIGKLEEMARNVEDYEDRLCKIREIAGRQP